MQKMEDANHEAGNNTFLHTDRDGCVFSHYYALAKDGLVTNSVFHIVALVPAPHEFQILSA